MTDEAKDAVKDKFAQRFENIENASDDNNDNPDQNDNREQNETNPEKKENAKNGKNGQNSGSVRVKGAWPNHSVYLPETTADDLSAAYKKLDWQLTDAYGLDIKKTRHYYPLIIQLGLERFEELEQQEVKERIEQIEPEDGYFD